MARSRFALCCALRHVFFNDYGLERTYIMSDILALLSYYIDADTPVEIISNQKKLTLWLTKAEMIRKLQLEQGDAVLDNLMRELDMINLIGLTQYIKEKALAAGDLSLEHIKGDNDKW